MDSTPTGLFSVDKEYKESYINLNTLVINEKDFVLDKYRLATVISKATLTIRDNQRNNNKPFKA